MRRATTTWLLTAVAMLAVGPTLALATGPSAGDNQYTDPLKSTTTQQAPPTATTSPPATTTPPPATSSSGTTATTTTQSAIASAPATTATTGSSASSTTSATLPRTGYDAWLAILLGGGLITLGAGIRLRYLHR